MTHPWLIDCADRLEAAAEVARDLRGLASIPLPAIRVRLEYLAERLWETAQRVGVLRELAPGPRAQLAHALSDLYRVARRAHALAVSNGTSAAVEGLEAIASELFALVREVASLGAATAGEPAAKRTPLAAGGCW